MDYHLTQDANGKLVIKTGLTGYALIGTPLLNKGTGFTAEERTHFNLLGIIPPNHATLSLQRERSYETLSSKNTPLEKYIYLRDLQDSNETLFISLLAEHITELLPIVYTPTVGLGCIRFSHIYRRPRGVYITYPDEKHIHAILAHPRFDHVRAIVVSDGERILGLGDQGAGGMGIPIGKLALYSACAGIYPGLTLPILLDVGTNNTDLLKDPLYLGWSHERIRGDDYYRFVDSFVNAVQKRFPHVLLQWEDFAQQNANPILQKYRDSLCTFNDDIQGTAAVAAGTLLAAMRVTGTPLKEQRIVVVGAGSAGCGISKLVLQAMIEAGMDKTEARQCFYLIDRHGLLTDDMNGLLDFQKPFAQPKARVQTWSSDQQTITLQDVVEHAHPTLLIGVSGQANIFSENIVKEMAKHVARPIIFPLSNPTERAEATPADILQWTDEKAIVSTGSPFEPVLKNGKLTAIDQTNNCYIFPGLGLGILATKASLITDNMFMAAAKALAACSPTQQHADANLLPPINDIRAVSQRVALAVAEEVFRAGLAGLKKPASLEKQIERYTWIPEYVVYQKV